MKLKTSLHHPKRRGEWVELKFMARAAELGLIVSKPWGDSARYDVVVDYRGHLLRVQVKSTQCRRGRRYICRCTPNPYSYPYRLADFDFFALYIIPEDIWYIFPARVVVGKAHHVCLNPSNPRHKHRPYLEAWHLLHNPRPRSS